MKSTIRRTLVTGLAVVTLTLSGTHAHAATSAAAPVREAVETSSVVDDASANAGTGPVYLYRSYGTERVRTWLNPGAYLCKGFAAVSQPRMSNGLNVAIRIYKHPSCTGGYWTFPPNHSGNFYTGIPRGFVPLG